MTTVVVEKVEDGATQQNERAPAVADRFEQLKQTAIDFISSNSIFTKDVAACLVDFLPFEPDNIMRVLDTTSIASYAQTMQSCITAGAAKWIIAEKTQFSLLGRKEIIAVYYCNPAVFVQGARQSFIFIGKCKFHLNDASTTCNDEQKDDDADDRIAYLIMTGGQDSVWTNTSKNDDGAKVDFCTVWHSLYWFGLNDEMREECIPKRWFTIDQKSLLK